MFTTIAQQDIEPTNNGRGGTMHILLSPKTVGAMATGFMGTLTLAPGEVFGMHYHPYSDEYAYVVDGEIVVENDEQTVTAQARTALYLPKMVPHRLHNRGTISASVVFFCTPLAPSPELGHVLVTEKHPHTEEGGNV